MIDTIGFLVFSREEEIRDQKIVFFNFGAEFEN